MENEIQLGFGAFQSPTDYRDIGLAQISTPTEYPPSFFNDIETLPVWHQRKLGACVGHAIAKYKQYIDLKDTGNIINYSPRFLYALAKSKDGLNQEGTFPRIVMKLLKDIGCATENTIPNNTTLSHAEYIDLTKIPQAAYDEAYKAKISGFAFGDLTEDGLKQAIVEFKGGSLLMMVDKNWWYSKNGVYSNDSKDLTPLRVPSDGVGSGHEVYLYGYENVGNDIKFHIFNSWSQFWGFSGKEYFMWSEYKTFLKELDVATDIPNHILEESKNLPPILSHIFNTDLKYNDSSDEVKWLQRALKQLGFYKYSVTGWYGPITQVAVFTFQKEFCNLSWYEKTFLKGTSFGPKSREMMNKILLS